MALPDVKSEDVQIAVLGDAVMIQGQTTAEVEL